MFSIKFIKNNIPSRIIKTNAIYDFPQARLIEGIVHWPVECERRAKSTPSLDLKGAKGTKVDSKGSLPND